MFKIRDMIPEDKDFFFDSWLKSFRGCKSAGCIPNNRYYEVTREGIENLIARGSKVQVAVSESDTNHIYGWICWELTPDDIPVIHYLYIKDPYLKFGIDEGLLKDITIQPFYTYNYDQVRKAIERKFKHSRGHVPEIARRK